MDMDEAPEAGASAWHRLYQCLLRWMTRFWRSLWSPSLSSQQRTRGALTGMRSLQAALPRGPSGLHSLPKDLLVTILRTYDRGNRWHCLPSPLFPLRAVSRTFREAVDEAIEELTCCFRFRNHDEALRQRMGLWLELTPSRCPNLRDLVLQFHWSFDYLEHALRAVGQSCPRLQNLELHAESTRMALQNDDSRSLSVLSSLTALTSLTLRGFGMYPKWEQRLSSAVPSLTHLVLQRLEGEVELEVPPGLATLDISSATVHWHNSLLGTKLKKLLLAGVWLDELLQVPGTVRELIFFDMWEGGLAPALQLLNLEDLRIARAGIQWLPSLMQSPRLQQLALNNIRGMATLPSLSHLSMLRKVELGSLDISSLHGLTRLTWLRSLSLACCNGITSLRGLSGFTRLETLGITHMTRLTSLSDIASLSSLKHLSIRCSELELSDIVPCLPNLEMLQLHQTGSTTHPLPNLASLTRLQKLEIEKNNHIRQLPELVSLVRLKHLVVGTVPNLESVPGSLLPASLGSLTVNGSYKVSNLEGVIPPNLKSWRINMKVHFRE